MQSLQKTSLILALLTALGLGGRAQAQTFNIAANPNPSLAANPAQGYYYADGSHDPTNPSYFVGQAAVNGTTPPVDPVHDFFTFDLSSLNMTGDPIVSAYLSLPSDSATSDSGQAQFRITLYDVSTSPTTLNVAQPAGNTTIYNDLASGNSYGAINVPADGSTTLFLFLNSTALNNIKNSAGGYFSIGGVLSLTSGAALPAGSNEYLFPDTPGQRAVLPTLTILRSPVPEASTRVSLGLLLALGIGGAVFAAKRKKTGSAL